MSDSHAALLKRRLAGDATAKFFSFPMVSKATGGVAPIGWQAEPGLADPVILIDEALSQYEIVWAAAGHPHAVFPTTFAELKKVTNALAMKVGD